MRKDVILNTLIAAIIIQKGITAARVEAFFKQKVDHKKPSVRPVI